jgi:hypothetical protein
MSRLLCLALLAAFMAAFFMRPAQAQTPMICFDNLAKATAKAAEHGEELEWVGRNYLGIKMFMFSGKESWTVFIESETGLICSSPALIGVKEKKGLAT